MANFEDITGWREELEAFMNSEEGIEFFSKYLRASSGPCPKLTFEEAIEFAEEMFRHDEIREALMESARWVKYLDDNPDFGQDDENFWKWCPSEANRTVHAFKRWYAFKRQIPFGIITFTAGSRIAKDVANGDLPSLRSPETEAYAKAEFAGFLSLDDEGA